MRDYLIHFGHWFKSLFFSQHKKEVGAVWIYKTKANLKIATQFLTDTGLLITCPPIVMLPIGVDKEKFLHTLFELLAISKSAPLVNYKKNGYTAAMLLKDLHEKSWKSLHHTSISCSIRLEKELMIISKWEQSAEYRGLVEDKSNRYEVPADNREFILSTIYSVLEMT